MKLLEKFKNKKIAVIGTGYIGTNLINFFKTNNKFNIQVFEFDKQNISKINKHTFDYVFNCAGNSGDFRNNVIETINSNIGLTVFLLQNLKVKEKLISLSSTRVYGFSENKNVFFDENTINCFNNKNINYIYDGTKKLTESILINYAPLVYYKINIVRLSNVYGKFNMLNDATLIKKIIRLKQENLELSLNKNICESSKDYIYIDDAISGIIKTALFGQKNEIYNIASGKSYSVLEIAKFINLKINVIENNITAKHSNINIEKSNQNIYFSPKIEIKKGLKKLIMQ